MKKLTLIILILLATLNSSAIEFDGLNLGVHGKYVWRGITFNNEGVQQGDTGITIGDFNFNIWWNQDLADELTTAGDISEIDYTLSYSKSFGNVSIDVGYIFFTFPAIEDDPATDENEGESIDTNELYVGLSYKNFSLTVYTDLELAKGTYLALGYSKDFEFKDKGAVTLDITLGFTDEENAEFHHGITDESGASDFTVSLSSSFELSKNVSIEPYIAWSTLLGKFATESRKESDNDRAIWAGVNVAFSF